MQSSFPDISHTTLIQALHKQAVYAGAHIVETYTKYCLYTHTHTHTQAQPLLVLVPELDPETEDKKVLMCSFLPQHGPHNSSMGESSV